MLLSGETSYVMTFGELKFSSDKWRKGEFDIGRIDLIRSITAQ